MKRRSPLLVIRTLAMNYFVAIVASAVIALIVRIFVVEAFRIPTDFMKPTLLPGDHIFVNKLAYGTSWSKKSPDRGDVIVFSFPNDSKEYIKRVIGIAGDTVEIKGTNVILNQQSLNEKKECCGFNLKETPSVAKDLSVKGSQLVEEELQGHHYTALWTGLEAPESRQMIEVKVPKGHIFVLGDNRSKGHDSRTYGFLPIEAVKGKAFLIWFSIKRTDSDQSSPDDNDPGVRVRWSRVFKRVS